jgi:hypothetical protein
MGKMRALIIALCLFVGIVFGTVFYTSIPLKLVSRLLSVMKVETQGLSGNLASGVHVDRLGFGSGENHFILEQFSLSYSGLWDYFVKKEINVSELSVGKLSIKLETTVRKTKTPDKISFKTKSTEPRPDSISDNNHRAIHVAKIDVSNVEIDFSTLKAPFQLENWQVRNLSIVDGKIEFEKFAVNSNMLDLNLEHGPANPNTKETPTSTDKTIKFVLKPTYITKLRNPVSAEGRLRIDNGNFDKSAFFLSAFDGKFNLKFNESGTLVLNVIDLNFPDYFNEPLPIKRINFNASLGPELGDLTSFKIDQGEFYIGTGKISFIPGSVFTALGDSDQLQLHIAAAAEAEGTRIAAQMTRNIAKSDPGRQTAEKSTEFPKIELSSEPKLSEEDMLAKLMFSKKFLALSTQEKQEVMYSKIYYTFK